MHELLEERKHFIPYAAGIQYSSFESADIWKYNVTAGKKYEISFNYTPSWQTYNIVFLDSSGSVIGIARPGEGQISSWYEGFSIRVVEGSYVWIQSVNNKQVTAPEGATQLWINIQRTQSETVKVYQINESSGSSVSDNIISVKDLKNRVDALETSGGGYNKPTTVVISGIGSNSLNFHVRAKYNDSNDIIISHNLGKNKTLSFEGVFIGPKTETDDNTFMTNYRVATIGDSIQPLLNMTEYNFLFYQHGYEVPRITVASADAATLVGNNSVWTDQHGYTYKIGKVNSVSGIVDLLPQWSLDNENHLVRGWKKLTNDTRLSYINDGTTQISVTNTEAHQIPGIMSTEDRKFFVDGIEITADGTYKCNEFSVSESQIGYDPATITTWYDGNGNESPNLTNAGPLAEFTYSFNYKGPQCTVNTTINLKKEVEFSRYGACQQQFFTTQDGYQPYFMFPKTLAYNTPTQLNVETTYSVLKNSEHLIDETQIPDRVIGFLKKNDSYRIGMAAGYSLISGDTTNAKRNVNISTDATTLSFNTEASNKNKVYFTAFEQGSLSGTTYFPENYFKEINYYVSFFDPSENVGQVYWYKDGNEYVIYTHCQESKVNQAIKVPDFMEGLHLSVIEKTNGASLLTDTIHNSKFFVNYDNTSNYIVLRTGHV